MPILYAVIIMLVLAVAMSFLMPRPKMTQADPQELGMPKVNPGAMIGVLFGTRVIKTPLLTWWGDLQIIKAKPEASGKK